ncbi:MAG TPA: PIG-L family deacetylase [Gemmatimonadaceae bacterium]|nr:PIG-L family deacetylase [Gemmatimonadaceae bacterium]
MPHPLSSQGGSVTARSSHGNAPGERIRVLWIAAHPDDEDTQLIAWLARGRNVETAYLSLTRGDGGQNLIGNELGEELGVLRTAELLAARRVDGGHQYFARAYDFGFSKTAEEAYRHWPKDSVLRDIVKIVRAFRPHIIGTTFSGTPRDGHGQHQISAILTREAYDLAADIGRFPAAEFGQPWTPLKLYRFARFSPEAATLSINVGEFNSALGQSYAEIAAESRSQHKSQGFGTLRRRGVVLDHLTRVDSRVPAPADAKQEKSIFDGIDLGGSAGLTPVAVGDTMSAVVLDAVADRRAVALGDSAQVTMTVLNRGAVAATVIAVNGNRRVIQPDSSVQWKQWEVGRELTQPWWLVRPRNGDLYGTPLSVIAEDELEKRRWARVSVEIPGRTGTREIRAPIVYHYVDLVRGDMQQPLIVAPAISVALEHATEMAPAGRAFARPLRVTLRSALRDSVPVTVRLRLPAGLTVDAAERAITLGPGATRVVTFRLRGSLARGVHEIAAVASARGTEFQSGYVPIEYAHITPQRVYRASSVRVHAVDVALPANMSVGYVSGVGDNVGPVLEQLGVSVTMIQPDDLPITNLARFRAIVVGPRAYQSSQTLADNNEYLLEYVRNGGRLVVQYGQAEMMRPGMMPYAMKLAARAERVTDETAPVTVLDAASPFLNRPNRITAADFEGWVQERASYMPTTFDERYKTLLSMNDPGEQANRAAILTASYGKGTYIYVPLALFRQLPAGVAGGARIFANLLSSPVK